MIKTNNERASSEQALLVVGGDHHNTLSAVRSFGRGRIPFDLILHGCEDYSRTHIGKSKYAPADALSVPEGKEALEVAIVAWISSNQGKQQYIYPCSDLSAMVADCLSKEYNFICPGYIGRPGYSAGLMNKYAQNKWAEKTNVEVARSWILDLSDESMLLDPPCLPCILKPIVSAEGKKSDISVVGDADQWREVKEHFALCGYDIVLVQEYLKYDYEIVVPGCIYSGGQFVFDILKKLVMWPINGGSTVVAESIKCPEICQVIEVFLQLLSLDGYRGPFDIEFFVRKDELILNEVNYRQSGVAYALIDEGCDFPVLWFSSYSKDSLEAGAPIRSEVPPKKVAINDLALASAVKRDEVSFRDGLSYFARSHSRAFFSADDMGCFFGWLSSR